MSRRKNRKTRAYQNSALTANLQPQTTTTVAAATEPAQAQTPSTPQEVRGMHNTVTQTQRIELLPLKAIQTDCYQRVLNARNVAGIAANFNVAKLGVLVVSKRGDGSYAVLDGQHRLTAMRLIDIEAANCVVLEGMTLQEEADYFRTQNQNKQNLRITDTFNAGLVAEDADYLKVKYLLDKYCFRIGKSRVVKAICAVDALIRILKSFGYDALEYVLAAIDGTWPCDTTIVRREMLAGLAEFAVRFMDRVSVEQFQERMAGKVPMTLYQEAQTRNHGKSTPGTAFNKSVRFATCDTLVDAYNKGLGARSRYRLTMEWGAPGRNGAK